ncbi:trypsin-like [Hyla sarda]|uniref:trypsin-like n=1 Tax=Hyla sarda TaxID=327740 RepID=UPI0024C4490E|nr:trypsin-like [Hyla sarda]
MTSILSKPHGGEADDRIMNGFDCTKNSITYQVSLRTAGTHFCGGALIADQWVLTSAQCFKGSVQVVLGEHDIKRTENTEQYNNSIKVIRHQAFNPRTLDNDIMLIKLASTPTFNNFVNKASLPTGCVGPNSFCQVSGWGITLTNNGKK